MSALLLLLLLRLVFWFTTFPNPDEAYYWLWGQHPALSYYDHPPLLAWVQAAFTTGFGQSFFMLRLPNLLSNAALFWTYWRISRYLYGEKARSSFWLVVLLVLTSPLYFLFLALAWPDHLLITFSLGSAFLFITFLDGYRSNSKGENWRLYGAATLLGLAGLCKYNAVFVGLGFGATILANKSLRPLLRDRRLYLATAIALSVLVPILLWNVSNDFQSFRYYADRSVRSSSLSLNFLAPLGFLALSSITVSPFHCARFYCAWKSGFPGIRTQSFYFSVAFWVFAASTFSITALSLVSTALYYWNITAYLLLFPLVPSLIPASPRLSVPAQVYGLCFAALLVVHYSVLPLSALVSKDGDPDSRMLFGWPQVAAVVTQAAASEQPVLVTTDYRSAAALAYQLNNKNVMAISDRVDQFDFWADGRAIAGQNAILISDDWHPLPSQLLAQFARTSEPIIVAVDRFGVWIKNYYVRRGYGFRATPTLNLP